MLDELATEGVKPHAIELVEAILARAKGTHLSCRCFMYCHCSKPLGLISNSFHFVSFHFFRSRRNCFHSARSIGETRQ